ncbi:MAG: nitroreductase family protein [Caulobacter sp.]|nr:nitroreductase family protein [Caulobacter sp.]
MTGSKPDRTLDLEPLAGWIEYSPAVMADRARVFLEGLKRRRTVRDFSPRPVPREIIETCLLAAGTAPSGANLQPWHFAVISDPARKQRIRQAAESEERAFYAGKAGAEWLEALAPLGTDPDKPFLEIAPWLIVIFAQRRSGLVPGESRKTYYFNESVGIATGLLIAALHEAGLVTLTHTPAPMGFLNEICERPATEKPFLVLVAGYPAADARTPRYAAIKKPLESFTSWL